MLEFKREVLFAQLKKALPEVGNVHCTTVWLITKGGVSLHLGDLLLTARKMEKQLRYYYSRNLMLLCFQAKAFLMQCRCNEWCC